MTSTVGSFMQFSITINFLSVEFKDTAVDTQIMLCNVTTINMYARRWKSFKWRVMLFSTSFSTNSLFEVIYVCKRFPFLLFITFLPHWNEIFIAFEKVKHKYMLCLYEYAWIYSVNSQIFEILTASYCNECAINV